MNRAVVFVHANRAQLESALQDALGALKSAPEGDLKGADALHVTLGGLEVALHATDGGKTGRVGVHLHGRETAPTDRVLTGDDGRTFNVASAEGDGWDVSVYE